MGCLGMHFSLDQADADRVVNAPSHDELVELITEDIEEHSEPEWSCSTDKAWDAIHRTLTNGLLDDEDCGPMSLCVLGGELLTTEDDYVACLVRPEQVKAAAEEMEKLDQRQFSRRYFEIDEDDYGMELSEEDLEYTWTNFIDLREFFRRAAAGSRYVLFTVDL